MIGVLFDFNGTMFFDETFQEISWRNFIGGKIGRDITEAEFQEYIHGRNADVSLPYFFNRALSREEITELEEEKEIIYRDLCLQSADFRLADGLIPFLDILKERNIPATIATASGWNNVVFFFEHLGLDRWFSIDKVVYNDGTVSGKPAPDFYLLAAKKLRMDIGDCVVFEDSMSGIESAKRAGARAIIQVDSMAQPIAETGAAARIENYCDTGRILGVMGLDA